ncbi:MAG: flagellar basal body L-ring protein FlgH [Pseudomonadota bacterium]
MSLFNDLRARRVGDILTVRLAERTAASKSSSTSSSKTTDVGIASPTVLGTDVTFDGTQILRGNVESEQSFAGAGDSQQSNSLSGDISVTVTRVLTNGNLIVRGEKHVTLNQGGEYIRLSGIVRQADILPDNSVESSKIANAQIAYSGTGALADANQMSWLGRFFNSPILPF